MILYKCDSYTFLIRMIYFIKIIIKAYFGSLISQQNLKLSLK